MIAADRIKLSAHYRQGTPIVRQASLAVAVSCTSYPRLKGTALTSVSAVTPNSNDITHSQALRVPNSAHSIPPPKDATLYLTLMDLPISYTPQLFAPIPTSLSNN